MCAQVPRDQPAIEAIDTDLLADPIEFLLADHYRQRVFVNHLDWLSRAKPGEARREVARMALAFMRRDLAHHVADEEHDVFPILRQRCGGAVDIEAIFHVLTGEHAADEGLARPVIAALDEIAIHGAPPSEAEFRAAARALAETQRRHLAWENAVILPLARRHLTAGDLRQLGLAMARRRGLEFPKRAKKS